MMIRPQLRCTPTPALPRRLATLAAAVALGPLLAGHALAQDNYWYLGLGAGQTRGVFDDSRITGNVISPVANDGNGGAPFTNYSIATDRRDTGYKVFMGYQLNRWLGFELGYFNLGKYGFDNTTTPAGRLVGELRAQGANLDLVGTLPLTENFALLGRVGTAYARTRTGFDGSGAVTVTDPRPSRRQANMKLGVGLQYAFSPGFLMRAEGEDYRINDAAGGKGHVRMYGVSLVFPLGRSGPAPRRVAYNEMPLQAARQPEPAPMPMPMPMARPEPAPVAAAAPMPKPEPMAVAAAPAARRVSYSAESLFGFDSSTVRPEGRAALDAFAAELDGTTYVNIGVEGYTDRIGSTAYNQSLSVRRADAVKAYLVDSGRIEAARITTSGKGEAMPHTKAADCDAGDRRSTALVACLQPDRRVEIEVSGTR